MSSTENEICSNIFSLMNSKISDDETDDYIFYHEYSDNAEKKFHTVIGYIEEIIMDSKFLEILSSFMDQYWIHFDHDEENKLIYSDIFSTYQNNIEKYIEEKLSEKIEHFDMKKFEHELMKRRNDLDGEIFEILATFSDFLEFKQMFLDYKEMKEGSAIDFSNDLMIRKCEIETSHL